MFLLAVVFVALLSHHPHHHPALTVRQARIVMRSYADLHNFGGFRIIRCRHESPSRVACRIHENPYYDYQDGEYDTYVMRVRRRGCGFDVADGGSGTVVGGFDVIGADDWQRWL